MLDSRAAVRRFFQPENSVVCKLSIKASIIGDIFQLKSANYQRVAKACSSYKIVVDNGVSTHIELIELKVPLIYLDRHYRRQLMYLLRRRHPRNQQEKN